MSDGFERLWVLRPMGSRTQTESEYEYIIASKKSTTDELVQKYQQYLSFCKQDRS